MYHRHSGKAKLKRATAFMLTGETGEFRLPTCQIVQRQQVRFMEGQRNPEGRFSPARRRQTGHFPVKTRSGTSRQREAPPSLPRITGLCSHQMEHPPPGRFHQNNAPRQYSQKNPRQLEQQKSHSQKNTAYASEHGHHQHLKKI